MSFYAPPEDVLIAITPSGFAIRPVTRTDGPSLQVVFGTLDATATSNLGIEPRVPQTDRECAEFAEALATARSGELNLLQLAWLLETDGKPAGLLTAQGPTTTRGPELAIVVTPDCRRRHLAEEALRTAIDILFQHTEVEWLVGIVKAGNHASVAMLTKLGFSLEGPSPEGDVYYLDRKVPSSTTGQSSSTIGVVADQPQTRNCPVCECSEFDAITDGSVVHAEHPDSVVALKCRSCSNQFWRQANGELIPVGA